MQFAYNDEQQMLHDSAHRFGADEWNAAERLKNLAEGADGNARRWAQMAELGWLMLPIAESDGGLGGGPIEIMAIMEGIGRHLMTEAYVSYCVLAPALMQGGGDHCTHLLEQVGAGQVRIATALIEEEGFDVASIRTVASDSGDGYRLTGAKAHVEDGAKLAGVLRVPGYDQLTVDFLRGHVRAKGYGDEAVRILLSDLHEALSPPEFALEAHLAIEAAEGEETIVRSHRIGLLHHKLGQKDEAAARGRRLVALGAPRRMVESYLKSAELDELARELFPDRAASPGATGRGAPGGG